MKTRNFLCWWGILVFGLGLWAWAAPSDLLLEEGEMDFDQVYDMLMELTPQELLADMERAYQLAESSPQSQEEDVLTPWTAAMIDRLDEFDEKELRDIILDKNRQMAFRAAVIQLREMQTGGEETDERIYQMLLDEEEPEYLRTTLLLHLEFSTPEHQALLEELAGQEGDLGEYAQKKLEWSEREAGYSPKAADGEGEQEGQKESAQPLGEAAFSQEERAACWTILLFSLSFLVGAGVWRQLQGRLFPPEQEE